MESKVIPRSYYKDLDCTANGHFEMVQGCILASKQLWGAQASIAPFYFPFQ